MLSSLDKGAWKPVLQYSVVYGNLIKRHASISAAARYVNSSLGKIQDVISGAKKSHKGMTFIFETEYNNRRTAIIKKRYTKAIPKNGRDLAMFDLNNVEIRRFKKIIEASKEMKASKTSITRALSGQQKTAAGYTWKYID